MDFDKKWIIDSLQIWNRYNDLETKENEARKKPITENK